jgi:hypothetical protein
VSPPAAAVDDVAAPPVPSPVVEALVDPDAPEFVTGFAVDPLSSLHEAAKAAPPKTKTLKSRSTFMTLLRRT